MLDKHTNWSVPSRSSPIIERSNHEAVHHPDHSTVPFKQGNNFLINLDCETVQEIDRLFAAFGDQGKVTMPLQETFWAARFGMLTDRFGVNWMFNLDKPAQG